MLHFSQNVLAFLLLLKPVKIALCSLCRRTATLSKEEFVALQILGRSPLRSEIVNFAVKVKFYRQAEAEITPQLPSQLFPHSAKLFACSLHLLHVLAEVSQRSKNVLRGTTKWWRIPMADLGVTGTHRVLGGSSFGERTLISHPTCAVCSQICNWPVQSYNSVRCSSLPYSSPSSSFFPFHKPLPSAFWRN